MSSATLSWIGPPPGRSRTLAGFRVWRWTDADLALAGDALSPALADPPGAEEPGLALSDAGGRPRWALARHPRGDGRGTPSQALLAFAGGRWSLAGAVAGDGDELAVRTSAGDTLMTWRRPGRIRSLPFDRKDVVDAGARRLVATEIRPSLAARLFSGRGRHGVRLTDAVTGEPVAEAVVEGDAPWNGDAGRPLAVSWGVPADDALEVALLVLTQEALDASDSGHTDS